MSMRNRVSGADVGTRGLVGRRPGRRVAVGVAVVLAVAAALWAVPTAGADDLSYGSVGENTKRQPKWTGAGDGEVTISWTHDAHGATGYFYQYWVPSPGLRYFGEEHDAGKPADKSFTITGLTNGTLYTVSVTPYIRESNGTISKRGATTTIQNVEPNELPDPPTNLTAQPWATTNRFTGRARLRWQVPSSHANIDDWEFRVGTTGTWKTVINVAHDRNPLTNPSNLGNIRAGDATGSDFPIGATVQIYLRSSNSAGTSSDIPDADLPVGASKIAGPASMTVPQPYWVLPAHYHGEVAAKTSGCTDRPGVVPHWDVEHNHTGRINWGVDPVGLDMTADGTNTTCNNPESIEIWYAKAATVGTDDMSAREIMEAQRVSGTSELNNATPAGTTASHVSRLLYNIVFHAPISLGGSHTVAGAGTTETEFCFMTRVNFGELPAAGRTDMTNSDGVIEGTTWTGDPASDASVSTANQRGMWSPIGCMTVSKSGSKAVFVNNCVGHTVNLMPTSTCTPRAPTES